MIGWLQGKAIDYWNNGARAGVILSCSGVGYEVQLLVRDLNAIRDSKDLTFWIHQVQKEDGSNLIGFIEKSDRDFFRQLISVNGVGPQLAISLLNATSAHQLIDAINQKNISQLISCPGIGKRTAERLMIELKNKIPQRSNLIINLSQNNNALESNIPVDLYNDVQSALINLGYTELEIHSALNELKKESKSIADKKGHIKEVSQNLDFQTLLKDTLLRINTETGKKAT